MFEPFLIVKICEKQMDLCLAHLSENIVKGIALTFYNNVQISLETRGDFGKLAVGFANYCTP